METVEVLTKARELIADPEHWTQLVEARNADGASVAANDPDASQWCAIGAVAHVGGQAHYPATIAALAACAENGLVTVVNDTTNHPTVLAMFDCAITKASA